MSKTIHIASAADEKYKRYLISMMTSAMQSAGSGYHIVFYILGDGFTDETVRLFETFVHGKGHTLKWLADTAMEVDIPITMYFSRAASLRLFLAEMIPDEIDEIIYLDSDTIVCEGGIERLAAVDIQNHALGVVADADIIFKYMTRRTGITDTHYRYFNSGVLIINLKKWRAQNASQKHADVLKERYEKLLYVDQDALNICWKDDLYYLPLNFNVTSANYAFSAKFLAKGYGSPYYSVAEIEAAKANPYILHFYGYLENRPWKEVCYHPKKQAYIDAANASPYGFQLEKSTLFEKYKYTRIYILKHWEPKFLRAMFSQLAKVKRFVLGIKHRIEQRFAG